MNSYIFTGNDFNPAYFRKVKKKPLWYFENKKKFNGAGELFGERYKMKNQTQENIKKKLKGNDLCRQEQLKRIIYIWSNVHMYFPSAYEPEDCEWVLIEDQHEYFWFNEPQSPSFPDISLDAQGFVLVFDEPCTLYFFPMN